MRGLDMAGVPRMRMTPKPGTRCLPPQRAVGLSYRLSGGYGVRRDCSKAVFLSQLPCPAEAGPHWMNKKPT